MSQCRWGFLSTASIGQKNWKAIRLAENAKVTAVASRDKAKSEAFIAACNAHTPVEEIPVAHDSYDALIEDPNVDSVYIPLPTGLRKEWVFKAARAGKHVLCEKPCATDAAELKEMINVCSENNVQFMDGVMYMHTERLKQLQETINDGQLGDVKRIVSHFSFCSDDEFKTSNIRTDSSLEPHGCLGDLGWYTIRFALCAMGGQMPTKVRGTILSDLKRPESPEAVPMEFAGELFFENGASASFYNSFLTDHQQWASVSGTKGHLYIPDFVLPVSGNQLKFRVTNAEFNCYGCDFVMEDYSRWIKTRETSHSAVNSAETNLFRNFSQNVLSGKTDDYWPAISLKTQSVLDSCLSSARDDSRLVSVSKL